MPILTYNPLTSISHQPSSFRPSRRLIVSVMAVTQSLEQSNAARPATMYELLSISETAAPAEIKAAYKKQARMWHPDVCPSLGDKEFFTGKFMRAREAYEVLCDPVLRRDYDLALRVRSSCGAACPFGKKRGERARGFGDWESQLQGLQRQRATRAAQNSSTKGFGQ